MKVVINVCFGGFGLSPLAVKRLADLRNLPCYFFKSQFQNGKMIHIPTSIEEIGNDLFFYAYTVPNPDEYIKGKEWNDMSNEERKSQNDKWDAITLSTRPEDRTDPLLIQVVEELGKLANGCCAELKIVDIPDGVEWEIDEYDGNEHIAEKHQTWH